MSNKELIENFYGSFREKEYKKMAQCYHKEAFFKDEAFELTGKEVPAMWHMLCLRGKDLVLEFSDIIEDGEFITAKWEAKYTFSATKRKVHNKIQARFRFKEGRIIEHIDSFNFWRWSSHALGFPGYLLGWSSFLKKKVQQQAGESLNAFISAHSEYQD
ncbi:MAG: nuclear transport factor 2 family protein [Balneolaceae bacterium]